MITNAKCRIIQIMQFNGCNSISLYFSHNEVPDSDICNSHTTVEDYYCSPPGCIQCRESDLCIFIPIHYFIVFNMVPINILEVLMKLESCLNKL